MKGDGPHSTMVAGTLIPEEDRPDTMDGHQSARISVSAGRTVMDTANLIITGALSGSGILDKEIYSTSISTLPAIPRSSIIHTLLIIIMERQTAGTATTKALTRMKYNDTREDPTGLP